MKKLSLIACCTIITFGADVFTLGQVEVVKNVSGVQKADTNVEVIDQDQLKKDNVKRLSQIAYHTRGVYVDKKGGRAEQNFMVRGFDAKRVPLFIDGIPVYVPYDGNADFGRFTTFDLSQINISKGASSVLYGSNTMGGAINLITKKPSRELEGSIGYGFEFGRSSKTFGNSTDFNIASKQEKFYVQASGSFLNDKGQQASKSFVTGVNKNEDGGRLENSLQKDSKLSFKFALTPNNTDEYAIVYSNQKGKKEQPFYDGIYAFDQNKFKTPHRFWKWPKWDKQSVYFLSNTSITDSFYVKSKIYHDTYKNIADMFADKAMTKHNAKNSTSFYDDKTYGAGLEFGWDMNDKNRIKFMTSYKHDIHQEGGNIYSDQGVKTGAEPVQKYVDKIYSFALEDIYKFSDMTRMIVGLSYDRSKAVKAEDYVQISDNPKKYGIYEFDVGSNHALNYQFLLKHSLDVGDEISVSYAKKTYFPSMKDRYSKRLGKNEPNPYLRPETAHHYEINYQANLVDSARAGAGVFYSKVKDAIGAVKIKKGKEKLNQNQNIDVAEYKGFEFFVNYFATNSLELGGNYSYIRAKYKNKDAKIYGLSKHKGSIYADYSITPKFNIYLSQYMLSDFYSNSKEDTRLGGFATTDVKFTFKPKDELSFEFGISNLFDKNYRYSEGFAEEGRVFYTNIRYVF